jgi:hypothetical protein
MIKNFVGRILILLVLFSLFGYCQQENQSFVFEKSFNCSNCNSSYLYKGNFYSPKKVVEKDNILFVLDETSNLIFMLDENDSLVYTIGRNGYYDKIKVPILLVEDEENIYTYDDEAGRFFIFKNPAQPIELEFLIGYRGISDCIKKENKIYILSSSQSKLEEIDLLNLQREIKLEKGIGDEKIYSAEAMTYANGYFLIADTKNKRVGVFDENFKFVKNIGLGSKGFTLKSPNAIAADNDFIYLADRSLKQLLIINYDGELIESYNFSFFNTSAISFLSLKDNKLYIISSQDKKILRYLIQKDNIKFELKEKIIKFIEEFEKFREGYKIASEYIPMIETENVQKISDLIVESNQSFYKKDYSNAEKKYKEAIESYGSLKPKIEQHLQNSIKEKLENLTNDIKKVQNVDLLFILKDELDYAYRLYEKKKYIECVKTLKSTSEKLYNHLNNLKINQQEVNGQIEKESNTIIKDLTKEEQGYKEYFIGLEKKLALKRSELSSKALELNYNINLKTFEVYLKSAKKFYDAGEYQNAIDLMMEADNEITKILNEIYEYENTIEKIKSYEQEINKIANNTNPLIKAKIAKAYSLAEIDQQKALEEAAEALKIAKEQSNQNNKGLENYAILIFLIIFLVLIGFAYFLYILIKEKLKNMKKRKKEYDIVIKKAKKV